MLVELKCHNCGSQLKPEDISPQLAAARCHHCNALFALPLASGGRVIPRPEVQLPKSIKIEEQMDGLVITRRWLDPAAWFLLFFAVFWNGFMLVWHGIAISQGAWIMSAFGMIHTVIGIVIGYSVLAKFLNTTKLKIGYDAVSVTIGPVPWRGNKSLPKHDLEQFYCKEKVSHSKNGSSVTYNVEAVLRGNRHERLIDGLNHHDQALYIEQQLEKRLGIVDTPVSGEYGR